MLQFTRPLRQLETVHWRTSGRLGIRTPDPLSVNEVL